MNELNDWTKMQVRSAILLGHDVYALRTEALRAVGGDANKLSQREADSLALECAAYAEAALWRLKSVQERGINGGQGTGRPTKPNSEAEVGGAVPCAPQNKKVNLVVAIEGFIAAETAAGRVAVIGYWNADNKWVNRTAAQFITDLKSAYAQRAAIRRGR